MAARNNGKSGFVNYQGNLVGGSYVNPPSLFGDINNNTSYEQVIMEDLRTKIQDFSAELKNETINNQKLHGQCEEYADKLRNLMNEYDNYKMKKESKIELLEQKISSLKSTLSDEKEKVKRNYYTRGKKQRSN